MDVTAATFVNGGQDAVITMAFSAVAVRGGREFTLEDEHHFYHGGGLVPSDTGPAHYDPIEAISANHFARASRARFKRITGGVRQR
jgi:hypothetical protein